MSPGNYLLLYGTIVILLVASFMWIKVSRPKPTQLNLRKKGHFAPVNDIDINDEQELNVYFNFNGHMFDAYEVIGVIAGAPRSDIEMAYMKMKLRIDDESKEILDMAYAAINERNQWS